MRKGYTTFLRFRYFIDFRCGIAIFADIFCGVTVFVDIFCGIAVFGTPQCPPPVCIEFLRATTLSIREVASAIGRIVASFPGVMHGPLFYRHLEKD